MSTHTHSRTVGFWLAILFVLAILLGTLGAAMVSTAAAAPAGSVVNQQEAPNGTNETATTTTVVQIDQETAVRDYRFANGSIYVTIEAGESRALTVTQAVRNPDTKAGTVPVEVFALEAGTHTIEMPLKAGTDAGDAAVTLSTQESVEQGQIAFITPSPGGGWLSGDPNMGVVWASGLVAALSTAGAVYWFLKRDRESGPRLEHRRA
jgi:hypothetical protein